MRSVALRIPELHEEATESCVGDGKQLIALVIATKNRFAFLARQLRYYVDRRFDGRIYIGDSSDEPDLSKIRNLITQLEGRIDVVHREFPGVSAAQCMRELVNVVELPYVAYVCDDDFLVPRSLEKCRQFLEANEDYSAAHGVAVKVQTYHSVPHGEIYSCRRKPQPIEEDERAAGRLLHYFGSMSDVYNSVHRTETFRAMVKSIHLVPDGRFDGVLIPNLLSIIRGKSKQLDCLSLLRHWQDSPNRTEFESDTLGWITRDDWLASFRRFVAILGEELARQDDTPLAEAKAIVKQGFAVYLTKSLRLECRSMPSQYTMALFDSVPLHSTRDQIVGGMKKIARRLPVIWPALQRARAWGDVRRARRDDRSLQALLDPRSPYHADFMPIYRAVTESP